MSALPPLQSGRGSAGLCHGAQRAAFHRPGPRRGAFPWIDRHTGARVGGIPAARLPLVSPTLLSPALAAQAGQPPPVWVSELVRDVYGLDIGEIVALPLAGGGRRSSLRVFGVTTRARTARSSSSAKCTQNSPAMKR